MQEFLDALAVISVGIIFTVIVIAIILNVVWDARAISTLANIACPNCGSPFGKETANSAHRSYKEKSRNHRRNKRRGWRYRRDLRWDLNCPECGASFKFHPDTKELEGVST